MKVRYTWVFKLNILKYVDFYRCDNCFIFWPAFGCSAIQTLVKIHFFNVFVKFWSKNLEKWGKKGAFWACHLLTIQHLVVNQHLKLLWLCKNHLVWNKQSKRLQTKHLLYVRKSISIPGSVDHLIVFTVHPILRCSKEELSCECDGH